MLWEWGGISCKQLLGHKKKLAATSAVLSHLDEFDGRRAHTHVVVVQPHQDHESFTLAMNAPVVDFKTRLLCTLLCAAEGACRASSARLLMVMSDLR
ncbi:hypothetical protein D9M69_617400 [compost metagenome]